MGPSTKNPRKFRDKIALQLQRQDAKDQEFMAIMQEMSGVKRTNKANGVATNDHGHNCEVGRGHNNGSGQSGADSECQHNKMKDVSANVMSGPALHQRELMMTSSPGPIRHKSGEQRGSPYERSRSLSPSLFPSGSSTSSSLPNVPVILTKRPASKSTTNQLEIPGVPWQKQRSDPNIFHSLGSPGQGQADRQLAPADTGPGNKFTARPTLLAQRCPVSLENTRRRTTSDLYEHSSPCTDFDRKYSEGNSPQIIVTDYESNDEQSQSPYSQFDTGSQPLVHQNLPHDEHEAYLREALDMISDNAVFDGPLDANLDSSSSLFDHSPNLALSGVNQSQPASNPMNIGLQSADSFHSYPTSPGVVDHSGGQSTQELNATTPSFYSYRDSFVPSPLASSYEDRSHHPVDHPNFTDASQYQSAPQPSLSTETNQHTYQNFNHCSEGGGQIPNLAPYGSQDLPYQGEIGVPNVGHSDSNQILEQKFQYFQIGDDGQSTSTYLDQGNQLPNELINLDPQQLLQVDLALEECGNANNLFTPIEDIDEIVRNVLEKHEDGENLL